MGWAMVSTMSLSVLFIISCASPVLDPLLQAEARAREVQKTVDQNAAGTRKAVDAQERADTAP
jgi:hypothetical protein